MYFASYSNIFLVSTHVTGIFDFFTEFENYVHVIILMLLGLVRKVLCHKTDTSLYVSRD